MYSFLYSNFSTVQFVYVRKFTLHVIQIQNFQLKYLFPVPVSSNLNFHLEVFLAFTVAKVMGIKLFFKTESTEYKLLRIFYRRFGYFQDRWKQWERNVTSYFLVLMTTFGIHFWWGFATTNVVDQIFLSQTTFLAYIHVRVNRDHIQLKTNVFALKV